MQRLRDSTSFLPQETAAFGRIWSAGTIPAKSSSVNKTPNLVATDWQYLKECHHVIRLLLEAVADSRRQTPSKTPGSDVSLVFTNPRVTGTVLLGLCNILYWHLEGYGNQLKEILNRMIRRDAMTGTEECNNLSVVVSKRRQTGCRKVATDEVCETEGEEEVHESSGSLQRWDPAKQILHLLEKPSHFKKSEVADMGWLCQPETEEIINLIQSQVRSATPHILEKSKSILEEAFEEDLQDLHADNLQQLIVEDDNQLVASFFGSDQSTPLPLEDQQLTVVRHAEAPSARVRRRKSDLTSPLPQNEIQLALKQPLKDLPKEQLTKQKKLFPLLDSEIDEVDETDSDQGVETTNDRSAPVNPFPGMLEYPAYPFELRALTATPAVFSRSVLPSMCTSEQRRFEKAIKLGLRASLPEPSGLLGTKLLQEVSDERTKPPPATPLRQPQPERPTAQSRRDSEMDCSSLFLSSNSRGADELSIDHLTADFPASPFTEDSQYSESTLLPPSVPNAVVLTPGSIALKNFITKVIERKSGGPSGMDSCSVRFSEIVPPIRCTRLQAAVTLKHVLILATFGEIVIESKDDGFGDVIIYLRRLCSKRCLMESEDEVSKRRRKEGLSY